MYKGDVIRNHQRGNNPRMQIPVFGNGDVHAQKPLKERQIQCRWNYDWKSRYRKPLDISKIKNTKIWKSIQEPKMSDKIEMVLNHLKWSIDWKGEN